jgi:Uma2 family endonuclease
MPLYAHYGVGYAWLVDPKAQTLEAYRLVDGKWAPLRFFRWGILTEYTKQGPGNARQTLAGDKS